MLLFCINVQFSYSTKDKPYQCGYPGCSFSTGHRGSLTRHRQSKNHYVDCDIDGDGNSLAMTSDADGMNVGMTRQALEPSCAEDQLSIKEVISTSIPSPQLVPVSPSSAFDDNNSAPDPIRDVLYTECTQTIPDALDYNEANGLDTIGLYFGDLETSATDLSSGGGPSSKVAPPDGDEQPTDWTGMPSYLDEIESVLDGFKGYKAHDGDDSVSHQLGLEGESVGDPISKFDDFI